MLAGLGTRLDEVSDIGSDENENQEDMAGSDTEEFYDHNNEDGPQKRQRNTKSAPIDPRWFPWKDRITCSLDVLMHLPRSVFSEKQLDLLMWLLHINQVPAEVPSVDSMKALNERLQKLYGINSIRKQGALGHVYYVNDLAQIIAQEMANPQVREHLKFYPEDSGKKLSEARQAQRWLEEIPDELLTPMARIRGHDFYIHEPAMLTDGTCCIPVWWFECNNVLFAKCWLMEAVVMDHVRGWNVIKCSNFEVPTSKFLKNFIDFRDDAVHYDLPSPTTLFKVYDSNGAGFEKWKYTNPDEGNRWRKLAEGHRVVSFAMWMYCDDTSGNLSKKWNKHNSFLFTPAGLPWQESHKEYNVHFLCTSNLAPPLEMLDGIVDQLEEAETNGIWAWDCKENEPVLVLPFVLALLGDNPMQSEFASHIGLRGKYFCRVCWVRGTDANESPATGDNLGSRDFDENSENGEQQSNAGSPQPSEAGAEQMRSRITAFIKTGRLRHKLETQDYLSSYMTHAKKLYTKTKIKKMRTETGLKDTFQDFFIDRLFRASEGKVSANNKQKALEEVVTTIPPDPKNTSPVWRIKGLDPHRDTPVEILHVILLGFLKYMWRDLVQNQLKKNDSRRTLLIARLKSVDVTGLKIAKITEDTLVKYAGSLTGRDFRVIAQVVPAIIHDLGLSEACRETWLALCKLVPLVWQPEITDVDEHIRILEHEIDHFLLCASQWTCRWFNKPKFHIFVHLPFHIRRFGPAILFATEAFESFNAVIRNKSVHSNRQAPSRDIARAFAQGNRVRHLLSKGLFVLAKESAQPSFSMNSRDWTSIGEGPKSMVAFPSTMTRYLGLEFQKHHNGPKISKLQASHISILDIDGGNCPVGAHVIVQDINDTSTYVARLTEVLQEVESMAEQSGQASTILVQIVDVSNEAVAYRMPRIVHTQSYRLVNAKDILCMVNTQHHCFGNNCKATAHRQIRQEREKTLNSEALIDHSHNPEDCFLNTAQMRNAKHVQKFRIKSPTLNPETIIIRSVAREIDIRDKAKRTTEINYINSS
ncbi:hypothetical protein K435DRAFT_818510 [Dendrothele bispora CBS 962.96]|uniref:Uncharacterized protein n=1 Tax=Dendrothele bispora (strain CBS 962.96) TaxID=1314807 RepID=A0A4S8MB15_DENBC|nr:hypothetical protein K435DRAFT_818510 [Dendrothele bispora CBS 962.96]